MSSPQHPHDQGSYLVPQVEVYDYGTDPEAEEEYDDQLPPSTPQELTHSLAVRTRKSSSSSGKSKKTYVQSGSDTETESAANMSSRPSRSSASGKKDKSSAKGRHHKSDDWADVTEPEERRRIQNRIAQRKFREKVREQRERTQRDSLNQQHAGASYAVPTSDSLSTDGGDLSGLPWGSMNMQFLVAKGHEHATHQQGSRRASDHHSHSHSHGHHHSHHHSHHDDPQLDPQLLSPYVGDYGQVGSFDGRDSSGDDQTYYTDTSPYGYYDFDTQSGDGSHQM